MNINWIVKALDTKPNAQGNADVVHRIHWSCCGKHNEHSVSVINVAEIEYEGGAFIPFDELTEETVLQWLWEKVEKFDVESAINAMLLERIEPASVTKSVPWSK